jgi:O-antigen/teichoic acid export membrane protein
VTDVVDAPLRPDSDATQPGFARLGRSSFIFAIGGIAGKLVGVILLPIFTRTLAPAEIGGLDVLLTLGAALTFTLLLGLDVAGLRLYFDQPDDEARRHLFGTWFAIALATTGIAGLAMVVGSGAISTALFGSTDHDAAVEAVAVSVIAGTVQIIVLTVLRAQGRAGWFAFVSGGVLVLYAILAVILLNLWRPDTASVIAAYALALVIFATSGTFLVRQVVLGMPRVSAGRELLRLGLPLAPAVAVAYIADFVIRTVLLGSSGAEQVAFLAVATRFASVVALVVAAIQLAWLPRAYGLGTSDAARMRIAMDARWIVAVACLVALAVAISAPPIVELVAGPDYLDSLPALAFTIVGILGTTLYFVAQVPSAVARRTSDLGIATLAAAGLAVGLNLLFAPLWRSAGTAAAVGVGQFAAALIVGWLGRRRLAYPFDWLRIGACTAVTSAVVVAALVLDIPLVERLLLIVIGLAAIGWSLSFGSTVVAFGRRLGRGPGLHG